MKCAGIILKGLAGVLNLSLVLAILILAIPSQVAVAAEIPTLTSMCVATSLGNDSASANNGTTTTLTITGTNLTGVTGMTFLQGTVADPLITITNIVPNGSTPDTQFKVDVEVDQGAAAGARNVTVTTPLGTSSPLAAGFIVSRATISVATRGAVAPGNTFNVTINVNNVANLNACQFDLNYDPSVIQVNGTENLSGVTDGLIHDLMLGDQDIANNGWTFQPTAGTPSGNIRVIGNTGNATKSATGSGYLAQISFLVTGTAGAGTNITLSNVGLFNSNASDFHPDTVTNGSITVVGFAITNTSLPEATAGVTYTSDSLTATGGIAPYTWSATGLPFSLTIETINGMISGTPSVSGNFTVNITATDSQSNNVTKQFNLKVYAAPQITTAALPEATMNKSYPATTIVASGGKLPYSWSATNLPTGLSIDPGTGIISGTPSFSGSFNVTITLADAFSPHNSAIANLALPVYPVLAITTNSLPAGVIGSSYSATVTAGGGKTPYAWSATGLPAGLTIGSASGTISGTPIVSGDFNQVSVTVTDAFSPANTSNVILSLHIGQGVAITTASLPEATQNLSYPATTISATGGTTPYVWSIDPANPLPAGLSINASSGAVSGTPTVSGNFTVGIKVTDASTPPASQTAQFSLKIYAAPQIITLALPEANMNKNYPSTTISAIGGKTPYTWSINPANPLPTGLSIDPASGIISGTPSVSGSFNVTITLADSFSPHNLASTTLALRIYPVLAITTNSLPAGVTGSSYSATVNAVGGKIPYAWSATGLPTNLTIGATSGTISGTPTVSGNFTVIVMVTDTFSPANNSNVTLILNIIPLPSPMVTSLNPNSGAQGATLNGAVINGTNLAGATAINFSGTGVTASNLIVNGTGTQITATISIAAGAAPGQRDVTVTASNGTSTTVIGGFSVILNVLRVLPGTVAKGQTFNVSVTFTAPSDNFNSVGLNDIAPAGWAVSANNTWNSPNSDYNNVTANQVEYLWYGPLSKGTAFTAVYQVTVSANATPGSYSFNNGLLLYYIGPSGQMTASISGNSQVQVLDTARIQGTTYDGKSLILSGVTLTLDGANQVISAGDGTFQLPVATTGSHTVIASKTGYRSQTQTISITDLTANYTLDFKANNGLVPNAPDLSFVLACINKWKYPPGDGSGLDLSKILSVINAWKFPIGIGGGG